MFISASTRPRGLKRGVSTAKFYRDAGYTGRIPPDVRDIVGTLVLSPRSSEDFELVRDLYLFFRADEAEMRIVINGCETVFARKRAEDGSGHAR